MVSCLSLCLQNVKYFLFTLMISFNFADILEPIYHAG